MSRPKLYVDYMSQPSRACILFCKHNNLPVDIELVMIHKGDTRSPQYRAKNPLGKVPMLEDGDFVLPESAAIMAYLAAKYDAQVPQNWYPRCCPQRRAMVDAALHWYHSSIRYGCAKLVFNLVLGPRLGATPNQGVAQDAVIVLKQSLRDMESYWLKGRAFMTGMEISCADLLCCCEIEQLGMLVKSAHGVDMEELLSKYAEVRAWRARVAGATQPNYDAVHGVLKKAIRAMHASEAGRAQSKM